MFISKDTVKFYGSLQDKIEDLEAINYSLLEKVKPLYIENKELKKENLGLSVINEQLKIDKMALTVIIDRIGKEFEIPKEEIIKIVQQVEGNYEKDKVKLAESKINREAEERVNIENTYERLKKEGYRQVQANKGKGKGLER